MLSIRKPDTPRYTPRRSLGAAYTGERLGCSHSPRAEGLLFTINEAALTGLPFVRLALRDSDCPDKRFGEGLSQ